MEEERAKGTIERWCLHHIKQVGRHLAMMVRACILVKLIRVFRDWWLSRWAAYDLNVVVGYDEETCRS